MQGQLLAVPSALRNHCVPIQKQSNNCAIDAFLGSCRVGTIQSAFFYQRYG
jgi:hypothetical protein